MTYLTDEFMQEFSAMAEIDTLIYQNEIDLAAEEAERQMRAEDEADEFAVYVASETLDDFSMDMIRQSSVYAAQCKAAS